MALYFCKKCGRIAQESYSQKHQICDCCNSIMYEVPAKYLDEELDFMTKDKETEKLLIQELVKTSPEFDPDLFEHRDEILAKKFDEFDAKMAHGKAVLEKQVTCPYCHSTNTQKISAMSKIWSLNWLGMYGLGKVSKQWHCNNCDSDF